MWNTYLQNHCPNDHSAKFYIPCSIELIKRPLQYTKCIEEIFSIQTNEYEKHTKIDELNDTNATHSFKNDLLVIPWSCYVLRSKTYYSFNANID